MVIYVPGTEETDPKKQNISLQQLGKAVTALGTPISSFNARTGPAIVPVQGDYPTSLIPGTTTNDNATAGNIGQIIESEVLSGAAVSLTTGTQTDITTISLTAGDWDAWATIAFLTGATTVVAASIGGINTVSATLPTPPGKGAYFAISGNTPGVLFPVGTRRLSLASTTTIYLVGYSVFSTSTQAAYGYLGARRVR